MVFQALQACRIIRSEGPHHMTRLFSKATVAETIAQQIEREVASWSGVAVAAHRFGGIEFRVGRRELGHLHGNRMADLPFPVKVRDQLVAEGKAQRHHVLPDSGWVTVYIRGQSDAAGVIELFRMNYERGYSSKSGSPRSAEAGTSR